MEKVVVEGLARVPSFSHAVIAGDFVHVAGSLGTVGDTTELVEGGVGPQTTQTIRNIETDPRGDGPWSGQRRQDERVPLRHGRLPADERGVHGSNR